MILPYPHVCPRPDACAALADQYVARAHSLAAIPLDAEALRFAVTAAPGAASTFLVCHL